jgi:NarL family two-component system sensor histidine kinase YdfH
VLVQNIDRMSLSEIVKFLIASSTQVLIDMFSNRIFKQKYKLYFIIKIIITFNYVYISTNIYRTIFIGLIHLFVIQSLILYKKELTVLGIYILFCSVLFGTIIIVNGVNELIKSIPVIIIITVFIFLYCVSFFMCIRCKKGSRDY